jgi:hypothetical protein
MKNKLKYLILATALLIIGIVFTDPLADSATLTHGYSFSTNEQVTAAKLHALVDAATVSAISASDFSDGAVSNLKLAANAVTTDKILDGTITVSDILSRTLTSGSIATNAITEIELATNITFRAGFHTYAGTSIAYTNATLLFTTNQISSGYVNGTSVSAGAGDAGKVVRLNGSGLIDSTMTPFSSSFTSTNLAISSAGTLSVAHGLGAAPSLVQARLKCTSANLNYSTSDEAIIPLGATGDGSLNVGLSCVPDASNLVIRYGQNPASAFVLIDKSTGSASAIDNTKWVLILRAWK